jgi:YbgC/YbaW family acyl-CoA thioester hydrolase
MRSDLEQHIGAAGEHWIHERVRWSDVDKAGIIYFGAYIRFVEAAETELYRTLGFPWSDFFERLGIWLPRVHIDFDFHHPAMLDDVLAIRTRVRGVGRSSVRLAMDIRRAGDVCLLANCSVVTVCTDRVSHRARPLPPELDGALRSLVEPA